VGHGCNLDSRGAAVVAQRRLLDELVDELA